MGLINNFGTTSHVYRRRDLCYDRRVNVTIEPGGLSGSVAIPGSKSHTIRALIIAALASGESTITAALDSGDTAACIGILRGLGARIEAESRGDGLALRVTGRGGRFARPQETLDCANSGTTLYLALPLAALQEFPVRFDGDAQLRRRSAGPLLKALETLGARVDRENGECVPFTITGPISGGDVSIECPTSQYLSSLLIAAPLCPDGMRITVPLLNERPYVEMTLAWLSGQGTDVVRRGWEHFAIPGGRGYRAFARQVPADFSSATFLLAAAAVTGSELTLEGLEMTDSQGDREVVRVLERLGCHVRINARSVTIAGPSGPDAGLSGGEVDLNAMPDALPALAVVGTRCREPLRLVSVPQAREKETDRIAVMAEAIARLGGRARELPDGLVIEPGRLAGGTADSAGDHRVAMALAVAGLCAAGPVTVTNAEVASITYPGFYDALAACGAAVASSGAGASET